MVFIIMIMKEKGQCTDNCSKIDNYQYEFRKICYNKCPIDITYNNNFYCEIKCNKSYPFEIVEKQICTNFCGINDMNKKLCKSKYKDEGTNENLILFNIRKDIISSNFDMNDLNEENITLKEGNTIFTITTNKLLKKNTINELDNCINILKDEYNIENIEDLVIFLINENNKIGLEVYTKSN